MESATAAPETMKMAAMAIAAVAATRRNIVVIEALPIRNAPEIPPNRIRLALSGPFGQKV